MPNNHFLRSGSRIYKFYACKPHHACVPFVTPRVMAITARMVCKYQNRNLYRSQQDTKLTSRLPATKKQMDIELSTFVFLSILEGNPKKRKNRLLPKTTPCTNLQT